MTAAAPHGFVGNLCMALAHRYEPERLFVIFTGFMDEADTHKREPTIIMAAYLGHAYQWDRFETKFARVRADYGFTVFHAKMFKARAGEFAGWEDWKCVKLIDDMLELLSKNTTDGLAIGLEHDRYIKEYRAPLFPEK